MKINIGISNRHVHLTEEHINILFGNTGISSKIELVQKGQFATNETVSLKTDKDLIENVRIIGPARKYTQVEISKTDAFRLGVNPPVRNSGEILGSEKITIIGPKGEVTIEEGCIIANRHIHIDPLTAQKNNLVNNQIVKVKVDTEKGGIFDKVVVKVSEDGVLEMHIDTDDANGFLIGKGAYGEIVE